MLQVEGTCSGEYGYIICVSQTVDVGKGVIKEGTGFAQVLKLPQCLDSTQLIWSRINERCVELDPQLCLT